MVEIDLGEEGIISNMVLFWIGVGRMCDAMR